MQGPNEAIGMNMPMSKQEVALFIIDDTCPFTKHFAYLILKRAQWVRNYHSQFIDLGTKAKVPK